MTNNMGRIKFEVIRAIVTCFPKDYIEMAFVGGVSEKEFVDEIIVEFIKYAFDNSQEKHPLRYYVPYGVSLQTIGVRPHKEKINISKEIINKTRGAVAPYAAQIFTHLSVVSSRQRSYDWLRCEGLKNEMEM